MPAQKPDWIRLNDVPSYYYSRTGHKLYTVEAVRHWMKHGKRDYCNNVARLKHKIRKGLWLTRKAWVDEFIDRMMGGTISEATELGNVGSGAEPKGNVEVGRGSLATDRTSGDLA